MNNQKRNWNILNQNIIGGINASDKFPTMRNKIEMLALKQTSCLRKGMHAIILLLQLLFYNISKNSILANLTKQSLQQGNQDRSTYYYQTTEKALRNNQHIINIYRSKCLGDYNGSKLLCQNLNLLAFVNINATIYIYIYIYSTVAFSFRDI